MSRISTAFNVADLHCDLPSQLVLKRAFDLKMLTAPGLNPADLDLLASPDSTLHRCSVPQLKNGNVHYQGMAIFAGVNETAVERGELQVNRLAELLDTEDCLLSRFQDPTSHTQLKYSPALRTVRF